MAIHIGSENLCHIILDLSRVEWGMFRWKVNSSSCVVVEM